MKAIATNPNNAEPLPQVVVAVPNLNPEYGLLYLQPDGEYQANDVRPVYGCNLEENTAYTNGTMPPDWRKAVENGDFHAEVITRNFPSTGIQEVELDQFKNGQPVCKLIILNAEIMPRPVATAPAPPTCKVIKHPASYAPQRIEKPASKKKPNGRQLFLFPETDLQPQKETA